MASVSRQRVGGEPVNCAYCGILVGEPIRLTDGYEEEAYQETPVGPVCAHCVADPYAAQGVQQCEVRRKRQATFRSQLARFTRSNRARDLSRDERNAEIVQMHADGRTYAEIGELVGLSKTGATEAARKFRKRMAAILDTRL